MSNSYDFGASIASEQIWKVALENVSVWILLASRPLLC